MKLFGLSITVGEPPVITKTSIKLVECPVPEIKFAGLGEALTWRLRAAVKSGKPFVLSGSKIYPVDSYYSMRETLRAVTKKRRDDQRDSHPRATRLISTKGGN